MATLEYPYIINRKKPNERIIVKVETTNPEEAKNIYEMYIKNKDFEFRLFPDESFKDKTTRNMLGLCENFINKGYDVTITSFGFNLYNRILFRIAMYLLKVVPSLGLAKHLDKKVKVV